ncbi:MAG: nucleotidyltransferase family protein [Bacteroidales bacterium]
MVYTQENIGEILFKNRNKIRQFGAKRLGLFGSYSRGEQQEQSDLDFLVEFYKGQKNYKNFIHLCYYLEELFGKKVDLLTLESLPKERQFSENVLKDIIFIVDN